MDIQISCFSEKSEEPGFPETEIRGSAVTGRDSDDEVIRELDSHGRAGLFEPAGRLMIGPARGRVAGRVVVDEDQG
jgi:hypothetical protein